MGDRQRLPHRRISESFTFRHSNTDYIVSLGYDWDGHRGSGELRELFLSTPKAGTDQDGIARDAGLLFSLLVQYGCPVEIIQAALTRDNDGRPAGALGRAIEMAMGERPMSKNG